MKTKELIDYLDLFEPDADVCVVVLNPPKRLRYDLTGSIVFSDTPFPTFGIEVGDAVPFDEEETRCAEE